MIAHRGASGYRPENTLPAYALAAQQRADMIEIDLHYTRDGAIAVSHDAKLERLGRRDVEIQDLNLAELRTLNAGDHDGAPTRIPTLDEVLDGFPEMPFNLEIKHATRGRYAGLEADAIAALTQRGLVARTLFSSFYDDVLSALRTASSEARIAVLLSPRAPEGAIQRAQAVRAEAINPHFVMVDELLVASAHDAGLAVFVYTVDDADAIERLLDLGVDGIFTNVPDRMREIVDRRG
ncbi:MAG: glycerophosphodiester phosphodiesterase family protein [Proteobacteria bacterium]|nr:glycerophosphodiester phosphodiesterase family protein [Pseudomonadota bacterium]